MAYRFQGGPARDSWDAGGSVANRVQQTKPYEKVINCICLQNDALFDCPVIASRLIMVSLLDVNKNRHRCSARHVA